MKHKARVFTSNLIIFVLFLTVMLPVHNFAMNIAPVTPVKSYMDANLKGALNQEVPNLLDEKQQHLSEVYTPYEFIPTEADFATNKWQKYIAAVYVYTTDVGFIITTGFVDGRIEQKTSFDSTEVDKILSEAKTSNEALQVIASSTPDNSFKIFYESVYKKNLIALYTGNFFTLKTLAAFSLETKAPQLVNKIIADYSIYKKGNFYLITYSEYPSFNQHSFVSSSVSVVNKQISNIENANLSVLEASKLITRTSVISLYADKTYTLVQFFNKNEADSYALSQSKILGKENVKILSSQSEINNTIKNLKLRAPKK